jgi:hypothetical protein
MEKIFRQGFEKLGINPEEHPVLLVDSKIQKERLEEMLFKTFKVPAFYATARDSNTPSWRASSVYASHSDFKKMLTHKK